MSPAESDPREGRLADLLATYDDALAEGRAIPSGLGPDPDPRRRSDEARATLRQPEAIWPRADQGSPSGRDPIGPAGGPGPVTQGPPESALGRSRLAWRPA